MNKTEQQLEHKKNEVYMLPSERAAIRARILGDASSQQHTTTPLFSFFFGSVYRLVPATLGLILIASVPVAYASQESVPGDFLYGFEVHVVEELEQFLYLSHADQAEYHIERLEERLEELQAVIHRGDVEELVMPMAEEVREHTAQALDALEENGDDGSNIDTHIAVSALVEAHTDLIDRVQGSESDSSIVADAQETASDALETEVDEYVEQKHDDAISDVIAESVEHINELSGKGDSVTKAYTTNQLIAAGKEIALEDWNETLMVLTETRVELLKTGLLNGASLTDIE